MFSITVDDVLVINNRALISGKCANKGEFSSKLVDDDGVEYNVCFPFIKYIVLPEDDYMTLELLDSHNAPTLKGRTLSGVKQ
jgi:hypothetical protein